jgi:hypothetical protein
MKTMMIAFAAFAMAGTAHAETKTLKCSTGREFERFEATLDGSDFDPNSGYFSVTKASVVDNYATAQLICTGHTLNHISCVGFWFGINETVVDVSTSQTEKGLFAVHKNLTPSPVQDSAPWACQVL